MSDSHHDAEYDFMDEIMEEARRLREERRCRVMTLDRFVAMILQDRETSVRWRQKLKGYGYYMIGSQRTTHKVVASDVEVIHPFDRSGPAEDTITFDFTHVVWYDL